MLTHWDMSFGTFIVFIALEFYTVYFVEKFLQAFSALGREMTINEFSHTEASKYLFSPVSVKKRFDESKVKN